MKSILSIVALLAGLSCRNEPQITPETVTSIEYGNLSGLAGWVSTYTAYPQKQVFQQNNRLDKTCEQSLSATEWAALTQLVDGTALKKVKSSNPYDCADAGASWIIARSATNEVRAEWGVCSGADPSGIQPLITALEKQRRAIEATCR